MKLNSNIKKIKPSATLTINELSKKLESQGKKILSKNGNEAF